jgi:preprotein translocase subunit SecF
MEFFKKTTHIDFMGSRKVAAVLSALLLATALVSFVVRGLSFGIDFTGGTLIELGYPQPTELGEVRAILADAGYQDAVVQYYGTAHDILVRVAPREGMSKAELSGRIFEALQAASGQTVDLRRVEFVGPQVGEELREDGGIAMLIALGGILVYVALRFEYRFAIGAVAALVHDSVLTLGFFSVFGLDFDLTVLAAILAVIGYSLNDTIVVFDRIRENFRKMRKGTAVVIVNTSVNQMLSRTLMTSATTMLVLLALFVFGGELIHGFATALIIGIVVGTYSSIYIASPITLALGVSKADLMLARKEGSGVDARP